jgi:hypothetical protein
VLRIFRGEKDMPPLHPIADIGEIWVEPRDGSAEGSL